MPLAVNPILKKVSEWRPCVLFHDLTKLISRGNGMALGVQVLPNTPKKQRVVVDFVPKHVQNRCSFFVGKRR